MSIFYLHLARTHCVFCFFLLVVYSFGLLILFVPDKYCYLIISIILVRWLCVMTVKFCCCYSYKKELVFKVTSPSATADTRVHFTPYAHCLSEKINDSSGKTVIYAGK